MNNGAALRQWAHGRVSTLVVEMDERLAAVCRKPQSAKRVHNARKAMARLEATLADLAAIVADAPQLQARTQALRRRAGKVRDADVLCKRLEEYAENANDAECRQIETLRSALCRRRRRGIRKLLKVASKPPSEFKLVTGTVAAARAIPLADSASIGDANRAIVRIRFAELLEAAPALQGEDSEALHALRLCAKRLRYALQRLEAERLELSAVADALDRFAKALGSAHDSIVLAKRAAECGAELIVERSRRDRKGQIENARRLWRNLIRDGGPIDMLSSYARFQAAV